MEKTEKPVPRCDGLNGEFFDFCANHELRFQRCVECGTWRHMPRYTCAACGSDAWSWEDASRKGKLYTWTVAHRSFHPAFDDDVPYAIVVIEMDEGVRVVSQIVDAEPDALKLSDAVEVVFVPVANGKVLPKFKLAPGS